LLVPLVLTNVGKALSNDKSNTFEQ
jgi:hypothetical protein